MPQGSKLTGYLNALLSAVSFGFIPSFIIPLKQNAISMDVSLFYRFLFAALMIGAFQVMRRGSLKVRGKDLGKLCVMGILYALSAEFLFQGYDLLSPGIASTVLYTYPVMIAMILTIFFREKISLISKLSIFFALIGVMTMSWEGSGMSFNLFGVLIVALSALSYALYMLIINKGVIKADGIAMTFYSVLFSSLFYAVKTTWHGESLIFTDVKWLSFIALFSLVTTVLSVLCIVFAIALIGPTVAAILGALEPVVAVLISVLVFDEKASWTLVTGVVLIISALCLSVLGNQFQDKKLFFRNKVH